MHPEAYAAVERMVCDTELVHGVDWADALAVDLGGRDNNGNARDALLPSVSWLVLDDTHGPDVDVVADARTWRGLWGAVRATDVDLVLCTELLEHVEGWPAVLDTAAFLLRPGGWLILTCAAHDRQPHGARGEPEPPPGEWYAGIHPTTLERETRKRAFDIVTVTHAYPPGDCYMKARKAPS